VDGRNREKRRIRNRCPSLSGTATAMVGLEPHLPVPESLRAKAIKDWVKDEHAKCWKAYDGGAHTKRFFPKPDAKWTNDLLDMHRNRIRRVVGAVTGHCGLNRHMFKLRLSGTPRCSCGLEDETGLHIICNCPKFLQLRSRTLGNYEIRPTDVATLGPATLDKFLVETGRLL